MRNYENPLVTSENRMNPRSYYIPEGVSELQMLNGEWSFKYYKRDIDVKDEIADWDKIMVPSCWQLQGYDDLNYTNINYPYPVDPPYVPDDNPCGVYQREFDIKKVWGKIYFVLEGVSSCAYIYVNKEYVGFTQGSHLQAEFDITKFVTKGTNTIQVRVLKWCCGSYLEDQDFLRYNGIFRDCYILQRPKDHIEDVRILSDAEKISVDVGKEADIALLDAEENVLQLERNACNVEWKIENPILWNAEKPYLYTIKIKRNGEEIVQKTGMRSIAISEKSELLINGVPVKLHGVNHHDTDPKTGWYQTPEALVKDLKLMKGMGFNFYRFSICWSRIIPNGTLDEPVNEEGVKYNDNVYATKNGVIRGTSDHQIFRMYGYPSLVLGDDNIIDIVHTDNDNLDNVDYSDLEKLSEVIYKFISENRYDMNEIKTGN